MSDVNARIAAALASVKAPTTASVTRDEVVTAKALAAISAAGVDLEGQKFGVVRAALEEDGLATELPEGADLSEHDDITEEEIVAAAEAMLKAAGIEVEDDTFEDDADEELEQIAELTAGFIQRNGSNQPKLLAAVARLTAGLNLTVVAASRAQRGE